MQDKELHISFMDLPGQRFYSTFTKGCQSQSSQTLKAHLLELSIAITISYLHSHIGVGIIDFDYLV